TAPFDTTNAAFATGSAQANRTAPPNDSFVAAPPVSTFEAQPGDTIGLIKKNLDERRKPFLAIALEEARRVAIEGDDLCVEFAPEGRHLRELLLKSDNQRIVREACSEVLGRETGLRVNIRTPGEGDDAPLTKADEERLEQQRMRESVENHPDVQEMLRTFRAEIVEVRRVDGETS
ncbi:MAG: hypothetical protein WCD76_14585, partial [Pyrinomonadaceae bacterium]